jgi:hypothetical protein
LLSPLLYRHPGAATLSPGFEGRRLVVPQGGANAVVMAKAPVDQQKAARELYSRETADLITFLFTLDYFEWRVLPAGGFVGQSGSGRRPEGRYAPGGLSPEGIRLCLRVPHGWSSPDKPADRQL